MNAHRIVADEGEGAHQAELLEQEFGSRFVGFRFTKTSKPALIENVLWLCENRLLELPIDEEEPRNALLNVERREEGYEHASSKLKNVFDAMGLALTEARKGPQRSMDVLTDDRTVDDPSIPTPATGGLAGGVGVSVQARAPCLVSVSCSVGTTELSGCRPVVAAIQEVGGCTSA